MIFRHIIVGGLKLFICVLCINMMNLFKKNPDNIYLNQQNEIIKLKKENQSFKERFGKIIANRANKEIIEEIQIPNEPIIITANNKKTIISKTVGGENLCA